MFSPRYEGQCKWFSNLKNYGFINMLNEPSKEMFIHISKIAGKDKILKSGEYVSFAIERTDDNRLQASEVRGVGGGPLMCESNPQMHSIRPKILKESCEETNSEDDQKSERPKGWGIVSWFQNKRGGYGVIKPLGCDKELPADTTIFVHWSDIRPKNNTYKTLIPGEYVSFEIIERENNKGLQAVNVKGYKGGALFCDVNVLPGTKKPEQRDTQEDGFIKVEPRQKNGRPTYASRLLA